MDQSQYGAHSQQGGNSVGAYAANGGYATASYAAAPSTNPHAYGNAQPQGYPYPGQKRPLDDGAGTPEAKRTAQERETVFRVIISERKKGAIIGKGGTIIRELQQSTGARVRIVEPGVPNSEDRVLVISARDSAEDPNAAQKALYEVHSRLTAHDEAHWQKQQQQDGGGNEFTCMLRLLVCHTQAGAVIGKQGAIIKSIKEQSGAMVRVNKEAPPCGLANDDVVEISGAKETAMHALQLVAKQLRENAPKERPGGPPPSLAMLRPDMNVAALAAGFPPQAAPGYAPPGPAGSMPMHGAPHGAPPPGYQGPPPPGMQQQGLPPPPGGMPPRPAGPGGPMPAGMPPAGGPPQGHAVPQGYY